jgi:Uma2 family endonuclease
MRPDEEMIGMSTIEEPLGLRVGLESAGVLMTPEEFEAIENYDEDFQYELVHGVLVVTPFATEAERNPNDILGQLLRNYHDDHPQGKALDETLFEQYIRTHDSRRRADRVIWAGLGRTPDPHIDVPTIVVEFPAAGRVAWKRDYIEKRREYLALGVREYWVIDRFQRVMTAYFDDAGKPGERRIGEDQVYTTDLLPGFEVPLARLLAAADKWK